MDYINLFQTNAEFLSAYNGSDYVEPWVSYTMETSGIAYNKGEEPHDYSQDYLTFVMLEDGGTISAYTDGVLFSKDGGEKWVANEISGLTSGDKVFVKGTFSIGTSDAAMLRCDKKYNLEGNIMSVYDPDNFRTRTTFDSENHNLMAFFGQETNLISAENLILPVTALTSQCYYRMFYACTGLTTAPVLPATTLAGYCYSEMFSSCPSLITAPELPATTLAENCYQRMFDGCSSLTTAPALPATTLADYCYEYMFWSCTTLTTAPELPATTLANTCYGSMFADCTSLNFIKCLATDISAIACTENWVGGLVGVSPTGTFVKPSTTDWSSKIGYDGIPNGWTVQDAS